jgi:hypothetical protein
MVSVSLVKSNYYLIFDHLQRSIFLVQGHLLSKNSSLLGLSLLFQVRIVILFRRNPFLFDLFFKQDVDLL